MNKEKDVIVIYQQPSVVKVSMDKFQADKYQKIDVHLNTQISGRKWQEIGCRDLEVVWAVYIEECSTPIRFKKKLAQ